MYHSCVLFSFLVYRFQISRTIVLWIIWQNNIFWSTVSPYILNKILPCFLSADVNNILKTSEPIISEISIYTQEVCDSVSIWKWNLKKQLLLVNLENAIGHKWTQLDYDVRRNSNSELRIQRKIFRNPV